MIKRLKSLIAEVDSLYRSSGRDMEFAHWSIDGHIKLVAKWAEKIAKKERADIEICMAGAYLHDLADIWLNDRNEEHEKMSMEKAEQLLKKHGFNNEKINIILNKVIATHSCKEKMPQIMEGKVLATADAMAHLTSDVYIHLAWINHPRGSYAEFKKWLNAKLDRDFKNKMFFPYWKEKVRKNYEVYKILVG